MLTPPLGYWMKIAHGKRVRQPKLPTKDTPADAIVDLYPREPHRNHYEDQEGLPIPEAERTAVEAACQVHEELPKKRLPVVVDLRRVLREVHENTNGQRIIGGSAPILRTVSFNPWKRREFKTLLL
ncbi:hypothetical protein [Pseudohaliea sp.]|uniref:hypothetical protein n=1 Tax=Pseudohaliea sp. TaxID=2740289 RepID=UPI0032EC80E1